MKKLLVVFAVVALTSPVALGAEPYTGEVKKVDAGAGKVTLTHGAIKKFDMEGGMTMVYRVKDPAILADLKPGDKITFDADKIAGKFTVTKMEKAR